MPVQGADDGVATCERLAQAAYWMLEEMKDQKLEVVIIDTLRRAVNANPQWYRDLCASYSRERKGFKKLKTIIRRCHVERVLRRWAEEDPPEGTYAERVLPFVEGMAERMEDRR